jgi:predicted MFS family arabinose efflux permease
MARPTLITTPVLLLFVATFGAMTSFFLLLSVVPQYVTSPGVGAGGVGAGLATGALMLSTVVFELVTPRLIARAGYRVMLAAGLLLLGVPSLALTSATSLSAVLAVCIVRGVGVAIFVVGGAALMASLVPAERRGEGLGLYGIVVGGPAVAALPAGVWLAEKVGYSPVFIVGAVSALAVLVAVPGLPGRVTTEDAPVGVLAGLRSAALVRPALIFALTSMATGVVVTFLPLAVPVGSGALASLALFAQAVTTTAGRWYAGLHGDRHGAGVLLIPGVLLAAAGMLTAAFVTSPAAVVVGMVLVGAGFGVAQNASLTMMFDAVPPSGYDTASALWNLAYDGGLGLGGVAFGVLAARTGYPVAFAVTAALMLVALAPVYRASLTGRASNGRLRG